MSDKKVSELPLYTLPKGDDLLLVVSDPNGVPTSKSMTLDTLFGSVTSNTNIPNLTVANSVVANNVTITNTVSANTITVNNATVNSNGIIITNALTPANSSSPVTTGKIFYDSNYIYVSTPAGIKRAALSSF